MNKRTRTSLEQRKILLQFMMNHEELSRGRISGAEARRKELLLEELARTLNAIKSGGTKSPDKWWKCWQDWRSDTKAKALKIQKFGTNTVPLTTLEIRLLQFCGLEMVAGINEETLENTKLEAQPEVLLLEDVSNVFATSEEVQSAVDDSSSEAEEQDDTSSQNEMQRSMARQTAALERQAIASERQADALERLAVNVETAGQNMLTGFEAIAAAMHSGFTALAAAIERRPVQNFTMSVPKKEV